MRMALFFTATMELLKLQFVVSLIMLFFNQPFPNLVSAATLYAAFGLTLFLRSRGGLMLWKALAHGALLAVAFCGILLSLGPDLSGMVAIVLAASGALSFWLDGYRLGSRPLTHEGCVTRFDVGLGLMLLALSFAAVVKLDTPFSTPLLGPYLLVSAMAMGASKNAELRRGGFAPKRPRGLALLSALLFGSVALITALVAPLLFAPAARTGDALKSGLVSAEPYIAAFLRWLLSINGGHPVAAASESSGNAPEPSPFLTEAASVSGLLARIVIWGLGAIAVLLLVSLLFYGLVKLFLWLSRRTEGEGALAPRALDWRFLPTWLRRLLIRAWHLFSDVGAKIRELASALSINRGPAASAYLKLLRCARFAGYPRLPTETPREYARRLLSTCPRSSVDAEFIVGELEKEAYGGRASDPKTAAALLRARRRLRVTAFLAERIRGSLTRPCGIWIDQDTL